MTNESNIVTITLECDADEYSEYSGTYVPTDSNDSMNLSVGDKKYITINETTITKTVSELFGNNSTITLDYYSTFTQNTLKVNYKFYDRNTNPGKVDINEDATTLTLQVPYKTGDTVAQVITNGLSQKVSTEGGQLRTLGNILDKYYIWTSQSAAYAGIQNLPDYRADNSGNTTYAKSSLISNYNFNYHFNSVGQQDIGDTEAWVTYKKDNSVINETTTVDGVDEVTVWAYNTPKLYNLSFIYPKDGTEKTYSDISTLLTKRFDENSDIYYLNVELDTEGSADYQEKESTFYGQRLGELMEGGTAEQNVAGVHAAKYGITNGFTGKSIKAKRVIAPGEGVNGDTFYFDGWYDANTGVKVASDYDYSYRVTTGLDLVAGYKKVASGGAASAAGTIGVSLTKNDNDYFFTASEGETDEALTENVRYNIQLNVYNTTDSDETITHTAAVYVRLRVQSLGTAYTTESISKLVDDAEFMNKLRDSILNNLKNNTTATTPITYNFTGDETEETVAVEYYFVRDTTSKLPLTTKNRAMFTTEFAIDDVATNAPYSAILVFGAIQDPTKVNDNNGWVLSDNSINYIDITKESK